MSPSKQIIRIVLYGLGLGSLAALIYLAGPLVSIGGWYPLENPIVRQIAVVVLVAVFAVIAGLHWRKRKKSAANIAEGIAAADQPEDDSGILNERMKDAIATLKTASGGKADFLYDLPWYVLIGPPGSGKTTALVNSGLKFPLARGATPAAIAGVGGTRYCDWWFTEDAVMIDTAGRYTTQDSDAKLDRRSWLAFLDLLKKNRPRQPINGVVVAISLEDLMTLGPAEIAAHATAVRARLLELHERLKVDFPVYALFTKADLVAGFMEYFGNLGDQDRRQVWGATFQTRDKTRNLVGDVPAEYDLLVERLNYDLTDRLQEEPTPSNRVLLFGFPTQIAGLKKAVFDFLNQIFEPTRYHANATLRGFYFTSGTQEGTPIDRLIGALAKSFGAEQLGPQIYSGRGKSFFLTDLVNKVIIGEAAWVSTDPAAVRRTRIVKATLYTLLAAVSITAAGAWWVSYTRNRALIDQTKTAIADYAAQLGPYAHETTIDDNELHKVLPLLHKLRTLPTGFAVHDLPTPLLSTLGLSQRPRLQSSAEQIYHTALERLFRPRLIYRLEKALDGHKSDPGYTYQALKVYLMLGGLAPTDRNLVVSWMRNDWSETLYPGAANANGRQALLDNLNAMLDLESGEQPLVTLDGALVDECRHILARLNVADRAYNLLKSQVRPAVAPDWVAAAHGGQDFATVFETTDGESVDTVKVPGFYTYAGFQHAFIEPLSTIADQLKRDNWVLGDIGKESAIVTQFDNIGPNLLTLYTRDFIAAWMQALGKLKLRRLNADKPTYAILNAAAAPTSPIRMLLEGVRDETVLTRERGGDAKDKKKGPVSSPLFKEQDGAPGAAIEAAFKPFHQIIEGDPSHRMIDAVIGNLTEISNSLQAIAVDPNHAQQATSALQGQVATLKNNALRLPKPFSDMMLGAAASFEGDLASSTYGGLAQSFQNSVFPACRDLASGRYPLVRGESREIPLADFGRLFGPNGYFDRFFSQYLQSYADTSKKEWSWRQDNPVARQMSPDTLRQFQRAAQIRDAFFATGGNVPSFTMTVTPPALTGTGVNAKLEVNGATVLSQSSATGPATAASVPWPGGGGNRTAVTLSSDAIGAASSSVLERSGQWSLLRLMDAASVASRANSLVVTFIVGGRDLQYQITTGTTASPLQLPALREFKCPTVL